MAQCILYRISPSTKINNEVVYQKNNKICAGYYKYYYNVCKEFNQSHFRRCIPPRQLSLIFRDLLNLEIRSIEWEMITPANRSLMDSTFLLLAAAFWIVDTIALFCICCCLINCLRFWRESAEVDDAVGGHVCVDANDSSDSVTDGEERFLLWVECKTSVALVAAFRLGRVGGSKITIDVCGNLIGDAKSTTLSVGGCGGAGTRVFSCHIWVDWRDCAHVIGFFLVLHLFVAL